MLAFWHVNANSNGNLSDTQTLLGTERSIVNVYELNGSECSIARKQCR
jgi:hypothetical protein